MGTFVKKNLVTLIIVIATLVLAGIAMFTAIRLYQLRQQPIAPNVPSSRPAAAEPTATPVPCQALAFTISTSTPTATPTSTPTATPTATPTPTPAPGCYGTCTGTPDCPSGMQCQNVNGVNRCINPSCSGSTNCVCATPTPTPQVIVLATPTPAPVLPVAGVGAPTIIGVLFGIILITGALIIAL